MRHPDWTLMVIAGVCLIRLLAPPIPWLDKLPGDMVIECENLRFHSPLTTRILHSLLLTAIMWLVQLFPGDLQAGLSPAANE